MGRVSRRPQPHLPLSLRSAAGPGARLGRRGRGRRPGCGQSGWGTPLKAGGQETVRRPAEGLRIRAYALARPALKSLQHPSLPPGPSKASEPWVSSGGAGGLGWAMK